MSKIKIKTTLKNNETNIKYEIKGIYNQNKISFLENRVRVNIYIENKTLRIVRTTDEYQIFLKFQEFLTIPGKYDIKDIGTLEIETKTEKLEINDKKIFIQYILYVNGENLGRNIYTLEYEAI